ncbi:MAG: PD-(D/E)XK nuclease family protein, partial [Pedosphaera parvula]|nr:PD-(D/E)XK nuclease family protein [Pedosphaera parvula]
LANLTVGVIPPVLDQVLIGTIDRSRNPDLKRVLLLGLNEAVFPATPAPATLLTDADREILARHGAELGLTVRQQIGHERYYGYIACTRAGERLTLTFAARNAEDQALNPSPFISHLQRLFPALPIEEASTRTPWAESEHVCELAAPFLQSQIPDFKAKVLAQSPTLASLRQSLGHLHELESDTALSPALAARLYGPVLRTSVSRLEQFAACPFKFFVNSGLQADERKRFEVDARERGSFQHEVLARFHAEVRAQDRQWRDLTPAEARGLVGRIADEIAREFREGLFQASDHSLFTARSLTAALQDFIATLIGWMTSYGFDPCAVELAFGTAEKTLPAWELDLADGHRMAFRGKIDRIDLWVDKARDEAWCVVLDYKSSSRKMDPLLLEHGIQIQLPAYLAALCQLGDSRSHFGVARRVPAGVFYVNLRGDYSRSASRRDVLGTAEDAV